MFSYTVFSCYNTEIFDEKTEYCYSSNYKISTFYSTTKIFN